MLPSLGYYYHCTLGAEIIVGLKGRAPGDWLGWASSLGISYDSDVRPRCGSRPAGSVGAEPRILPTTAEIEICSSVTSSTAYDRARGGGDGVAFAAAACHLTLISCMVTYVCIEGTARCSESMETCDCPRRPLPARNDKGNALFSLRRSVEDVVYSSRNDGQVFVHSAGERRSRLDGPARSQGTGKRDARVEVLVLELQEHMRYLCEYKRVMDWKPTRVMLRAGLIIMNAISRRSMVFRSRPLHDQPVILWLYRLRFIGNIWRQSTC